MVICGGGGKVCLWCEDARRNVGLIFQDLMGSGPSDKTWEPAVAEANVLYKRGSSQQGTGSAAEEVHAFVLDVKRVV